MQIEERLDYCEKATEETFSQIKNLQNRHQQLIGYKQALLDVIKDKEEAQQEEGLRVSVESISQPPKSNKSKSTQ